MCRRRHREKTLNTNEVNVFSHILNDEITSIIHHRLLQSPRWLVSTNRNPISLFQRAEDATDNGFIMCTYEDKSRDYTFSTDSNEDPNYQELNFFASLVLDLCLSRCTTKTIFEDVPVFSNVVVTRFFWNYYHNDSKGTYHIDIDESNHWSIIFYINDCPDSGTIIIDDAGQEHDIPHTPGNAVIFPAHFKHVGKSPKHKNHRCCLNILFKADRIKNMIYGVPSMDNKEQDK